MLDPAEVLLLTRNIDYKPKLLLFYYYSTTALEYRARKTNKTDLKYYHLKIIIAAVLLLNLEVGHRYQVPYRYLCTCTGSRTGI